MPWLDANFTKLVNLAGGGAIYERAPTTAPIA
jgi:hypothetical protein